MSKKRKKGGFEKCDSRAFGFGELPLENNSAHKILSHFSGGFRLNYVHDEDCTDIARMQNSLF